MMRAMTPSGRGARLLWLMSSLVLVAGARPARAACGAVANADALLTPGVRLIVGEMHGNAETERVFGQLVCRAAEKGPVRVGLEIPAGEAAAIAKFLASGGSAADRSALLRGKFWTDAMQDGRRSAAMLALIDAIRELRRQGADVDIDAFDVAQPGPDRDRAMADQLLAAFARAPAAAHLVLVGNLHARRTPARIQKTAMTGSLVERGVSLKTLDARYGAGSTWACMPDCGPQVIGRGAAVAPAIVLVPSKDGAYDGLLEVGAPTFSPPAAVALTAGQRARGQTMKQRLDALAAYGEKQYGRCAQLFADAALKMAQGGSDDAYSAACCFALGGDGEHAFAQLTAAIDRGFHDVDALSRDPDLAALRGDARWSPLVERVRRNDGAARPR